MHSSAEHQHRKSPSSDSLTKYLHDIRRYPLLTRDEEIAIARGIREGDQKAFERLVCANLRFVVTIAKKYQNRGVALADLIDEGNLGLIRAAEKFDESKGVKFISYAVWWIRQSIVQALAESAHTVRVPLSRAGLLHRIGRHSNELRQELGREPTQKELAAGLELTESEIASTMPIARSYLSLDAPMTESEDGNLLDFLPDDASPSPDDEIGDSALIESVTEALATLRGREAKVLRLYFGFDGEEPMTLETIGGLLGITRERVRQIKEKALARIRKSKHGRVLASLAGQ